MSAAKGLLRFAGSALSAGCVVWIGWHFYSSGVLQQLLASDDLFELQWRVPCAALIYAVAVGVLAGAWSLLQRTFVEKPVPATTIAVYLVTQFYKYLPGGVLQYVGRHAALRKLGLSHASLGLCAGAEAACLVAVASLASAPFATHLVSWLHPTMVQVGIACVLGILVAGTARLRQHIAWIGRRLPTFRARWLAAALGLYAVFFLLMALTLATVVPAQASMRMPLPAWAGVAAASWIAGFVVIGAPAGLGVREAVFAALLASMAARPTILLMAACFRIATFGGDVIAWIVGLACNRYLERSRVLKHRVPPLDEH